MDKKNPFSPPPVEWMQQSKTGCGPLLDEVILKLCVASLALACYATALRIRGYRDAHDWKGWISFFMSLSFYFFGRPVRTKGPRGFNNFVCMKTTFFYEVKSIRAQKVWSTDILYFYYFSKRWFLMMRSLQPKQTTQQLVSILLFLYLCSLLFLGLLNYKCS